MFVSGEIERRPYQDEGRARQEAQEPVSLSWVWGIAGI